MFYLVDFLNPNTFLLIQSTNFIRLCEIQVYKNISLCARSHAKRIFPHNSNIVCLMKKGEDFRE